MCSRQAIPAGGSHLSYIEKRTNCPLSYIRLMAYTLKRTVLVFCSVRVGVSGRFDKDLSSVQVQMEHRLNETLKFEKIIADFLTRRPLRCNGGILVVGSFHMFDMKRELS